MPRVLAAGFTVLLGLMTAACGVQADDPGPASVNWGDKPWLQPAGTPLTAGVTVPEGARLIGPVLTLFAPEQATVETQRGYLFVEGDPYRVASDFVDQWDGATSVDGQRDPKMCDQTVSTGDEGKTRSLDYTGEAEPGAISISCDVSLILREPSGQSELAQMRTIRTLSLSITKDLTTAGVAAQGIVEWRRPFVAISEHLPAAPASAEGPSTVASDVDYLPDLRIVPGSFLAGPPSPGSITGGYVAVIGVHGDPDEVFDAYVAQDTDKPFFTADEVVNGMRMRVYRSAEAGGIWLYITLNEIDGNAWILVEAYND
jgi:hypothetical protein